MAGISSAMRSNLDFDFVVVGSGPNGLAAAIELARHGCSVCVVEAAGTIGGGTRSAELTLPGFIHDVCSAIHPLAIASPFFKQLPLARFGLEWIQPPAPLAHPFNDGTAAMLERSVSDTAGTLGSDGRAYARLMVPFVNDAEGLLRDVLAPPHLPHRPCLLARFTICAIQSAEGLARRRFSANPARSLFAGLAAHSNMPLNTRPTAAFALLLGMLGHYEGWPLPKGGSQKIADALGAYFLSLGGKIMTDTRVGSLDELPSARAVLCDVTPRQLLKIAGTRLPSFYRRQLESYRYGSGVFKVDWALSQPIPWTAKACGRAATVHLGGTLEEIAAAERAVSEGGHPDRPYVLLAQQSLFDDTRAPRGKHTVWAYCHVPNGSTVDMTGPVTRQIERFAPGFQDCILERRSISPVQFEAYNGNYAGGDISGGLQNIRQIIGRPALRRVPYSTPLRNLYICSSSTPPGGGVHGMCGFHAARAVLQRFSV